ncbi:MAG: hypothetical protein JWM27_372, partial [Gemmatimonadetes bacterium]|nr:hypothetical protein [Gemmatimonadota bacterium]
MLALPFGGMAVVWAAATVSVSDAPRGMAGSLHRMGLRRTGIPRLSSDSVYAPCAAAVPEDGTIPRGGCAAGAPDPLPELLGLAANAADAAATDPEAAQTAALLDVRSHGADTAVLIRSIESLRQAAARSRHPAPLLSDLAGVRLLLAQADQRPGGLLEAVEEADRAVAMAPRSRAARFNLALALDWLGTDGEASNAWRDYLALDSSSAWAAEARARLAALRAGPPPQPPSAASSDAQVAAFGADFPHQALLLGWDELLPRWAGAVLRGRPDSAAAALRLAERLGAAPARR